VVDTDVIEGFIIPHSHCGMHTHTLSLYIWHYWLVDGLTRFCTDPGWLNTFEVCLCLVIDHHRCRTQERLIDFGAGCTSTHSRSACGSLEFDSNTIKKKCLASLRASLNHCTSTRIESTCLSRGCTCQCCNPLVTTVYCRFGWVEVSFLERWWRDQSVDTRNIFSSLVKNGQIELLMGGWVSSDEATSNYFQVVNQVRSRLACYCCPLLLLMLLLPSSAQLLSR
jgi:hypothetical protein